MATCSSSPNTDSWNGTVRASYGIPNFPGSLVCTSDGIFQVHEDRNRVRWFCTSSGVARLVNGSFQKLPPYGNSRERAAFRIYEDPQGNLWTNKESGLFRASDKGVEDLALGVHARYMYSDTNGDLWVATGSEGLFRFTDRTFKMYTVGRWTTRLQYSYGRAGGARRNALGGQQLRGAFAF